MDIDVRQRLAKLLVEARGERSQREFAKEIGVSYGAIQLWEKCSSTPDTKNLKRIAQSLNMDMAELLSRINDVPPDDEITVQQILTRLESIPKQFVAQIAKAAIDILVDPS